MAIADLISVDAIDYRNPGRTGQKQGYATLTAAATVVLDYTHPSTIGIDPGGAGRDVTLEGSAAVDTKLHGLYRRIINKANAAESLTVKDQAGTTIGSVDQDQQGEFYHDAPADGTGSGWVLVGISAYLLA